ncbi:TPA: thioesterase [Pseudomonas aeruginosa]|nr:thioesterase [Pseudomonas aeruginosa]
MRLSAMSEMALWFPYANRPRGKMRLFTFPYAGSGASVFHNWFLPLYDSVDLYALQLPGRESRAAEAPYRDMEEAGGAIADCLANLFDDDVPYVFFGHSMGALLAYRVACVLRARRRTEPCRLVLSGMAPPHLGQAVQPLHRLPANQAITLLGRMGGVPDIVLGEPDLMEMFLPIIQADIELVYSHGCREPQPLDCALTCLAGDRDRIAPADWMAEWRRYSSGPFEHACLPGGHFFLNESGVQAMARIRSALAASSAVSCAFVTL